MEKGWTLPEIDGMDLCYYLRLMGRGAGGGASDKAGTAPLVTDENGRRGLYIDQFGIFQ